ncbi:hypothetical protein [Halobacteriovorax sp.]|uniref:hypothetical protein n=1 Tax=Halobacteriovorax sp. TaxID=2020862 RepID=UPI003567DAC4
MKLAILGSGPLALETALHFDKLGAHVTLFSRGELGGMAARVNSFASETSMEESWGELTTELGREALELNVDLSDIPSNDEYFKNYFLPLVARGSQSVIIKPGNVERVHKRFLSLEEEVPGKSRLQDLFRVVFSTDPKKSILNQVESNPELFEKLGDDVLDSLSESVEAFEDFDLIINAMGTYSKPSPMGPSGSHALNEARLTPKTNTYYGRECLSHYNEVTSHSKHIVMVGSGHLSALLLCELDLWLEEDEKRVVSLVTTEDRPFENFLKNHKESTLGLMITEVINKYFEKLQISRREYEKSLFEWRGLEPHIKAKKAAPKEPTSQLNLITASNVTALDKLLDREGLFVTCETSSFRSSTEGMEEQISTVSCDGIFVCTGHEADTKTAKGLRVNFEKRGEGISHSEPGYFTLNGIESGKSSLSSGLKKISKIETEIMNFFSRA